MSKFGKFYKDLLEIECEYVLKNGDVANIIPHATEKSTFSKYEKEAGQDYKNIVIFLTSTNDQTVLKKCQQSIDLFYDFNVREILLTKLFDNNLNNEENANDQLALVTLLPMSRNVFLDIAERVTNAS